MWLSFVTLFNEGGWVLYPIFGVSVLAWFIGLGKVHLYFAVRKQWKRFDAVLSSDAGRIERDEFCISLKKSSLRVCAVFFERIVNAQDIMTKRRAFSECITALSHRCSKGLSTLSAAAMMAPLLGLLGTISGMNEMFSVIGLFGFGSPTILSHGISVALQATLTGLGAAVAIIFFQNYLNGEKEKIVVGMEQTAKKCCGEALLIEKQPQNEQGELMRPDYRLIPQENDRPDINLAPFVDTIMILLIFFVVTANLYVETGIEVSKPKAAAAKSIGNKAVLIGITREGSVHIYGRQVTMDRLRLMMEQESSKQSDASVVIIADFEADIGKAVQVMDQCALAGIQKISIAAGKE
ncbi:MAG: MotA/TolQ/ExbB proton channel family protein [Chitinivibrionales bacterium]|nr:MotA/TolQ/ExbB proton channel family protein [Chitinivibrionales bacterium]